MTNTQRITYPIRAYPDGTCVCGHGKLWHKLKLLFFTSGRCEVCYCPKYREWEPDEISSH